MIENILNDVVNSNESEVLSFYNGEVFLKYDHKLHVRYFEKDGDRHLIAGATNVTDLVDKSGPLTQWAANETCNLLRGSILPGVCYSSEELETFFNNARFNYRTISKTATDIGHIAHQWLDSYQKLVIKHKTLDVLESLVLPEDAKASKCVETAVDWMKAHNFEPLKVETQVFSRKHSFAGTYDHLAYITACSNKECCPFEGRILILGDFKSSKRIYNEYRMQTACYKAAHEEEFPDLIIDARVVIRLDKEGAGIETLTLLNDSFEDDFNGFLGALDTYNWLKNLELQKRFESNLLKENKKLAKEALKALTEANKKLKSTRVRKPLIIKTVGIPVEA